MELGITVCCCLCNKFSTKTTEIILIIIHSIATISLIGFIGMIKISIISSYNIILIFFSLSLLIICLLFSVCFRFWRSNGTIKTKKKHISINMATAGIILIITCLFSCAINEYLILNDFVKLYNLYCDMNNNMHMGNNHRNKKKLSKSECSREYASEFNVGILYFSFSCVEFVTILGTFFFSIIRERIIFELDKPKSTTINSTRDNSYGRQEEFGNPIPGNILIHQKRKICPEYLKNVPQNFNISTQNQINNNLVGQKIDNNIEFDFKGENMQKNTNYPYNNFILPSKNNTSQQIINTQQSQINSSQSQIGFPRYNFSSNKQLVNNIGKKNLMQFQITSSERKF